MKNFTFSLDYVIEAETEREATNEFQRHLDSMSFFSGNFMPDKISDWNLKEEKQDNLQGYEVNKELVMSFFHISTECQNAIEQWQGETGDWPDSIETIVVEGYPFGWRIFTRYDTDEAGQYDSGFPELDALLAFACEKKCKWLVLDDDGPLSDDFQYFRD